jgi:hypothetical protein
MDYSTKHLNELCSKTPEGYLVSIDQSKFEGFTGSATKNVSKSQTNSNDGMKNSRVFDGENSGSKQFDKEYKGIFQKICKSMELYKCDNIPIITEFLEF